MTKSNINKTTAVRRLESQNVEIALPEDSWNSTAVTKYYPLLVTRTKVRETMRAKVKWKSQKAAGNIPAADILTGLE